MLRVRYIYAYWNCSMQNCNAEMVLTDISIKNVFFVPQPPLRLLRNCCVPLDKGGMLRQFSTVHNQKMLGNTGFVENNTLLHFINKSQTETHCIALRFFTSLTFDSHFLSVSCCLFPYCHNIAAGFSTSATCRIL